MASVNLDFRDQFLQMLNNRDKSRNQGFIVFVHGAVDLEPLEELCFNSIRQSHNRCFTVRYGAGVGDILNPLFQAILDDARTFLSRRNTKMQSQSIQPGAGQTSRIGQIRPASDDRLIQVFRELAEIAESQPDISAEGLFPYAEKLLQVGERLVLFCELSDIPTNATLEDLGFTSQMINQVLPRLPERVGLVVSGLPEGIVLPYESDHYLNIIVGPDYGGAPGTAPERSQPLRNDSPYGEDKLAITSEVNALADAIVGTDMNPPLVVGILGGWGSGKSFILHLLQERLRFIRNLDLTNDEARKNSPYVGHPYLVRFDAWTYAKSDLWASLMERILFDLDRQLNLERTVAPKYEIRRGFDLWEILENATEGQLTALEKELGQEAVALIKDWKQGGSTAKALWEALESLRGEELKKLSRAEEVLSQKEKVNAENLQTAKSEAEKKLLEARQKVESLISNKQQAHRNTLADKVANRDAVQARISAEVDQEIEEISRREAWMPIREELKGFLGAVADDILRKSGAMSENAPVSISMVEKEVSLGRKYWVGLWKSSASMPFLVFALLTGLLTWYISREQLASFATTLAGYLSAAAGVLGSGYTALAKVNRWFESKQALYEERMKTVRSDKISLRESKLAQKRETQLVPLEKEIDNLKDQFALEVKALEETENEGLKTLRIEEEKSLEAMKSRNESEIQTLKEEVEEYRRRAGIPGQHKSLTELIEKRIQSGYYQERLGILHQVQKDLKEITDALLPIQGYDEKLFPRGAPRIILLIDDLDRCPPKQVVQVLEAAQLLVKTRLFVVVIAMDVRFVTRALEKEYEGILVHEGNPSGLDYTEKIVQIPYRVRPIAPEAMASYLTSQVEIKQTHEETSAAPHPNDSGDRPAALITPPGRANTRVNEALPPEVQQFEPAEIDLLKNAAISVEISPRATKRLVNVMKLIKNIWYRKGIPQPSIDVQKAIVLLLTLSASYPETMARILDELERAYRISSKLNAPQNLRGMLQSIINRWCRQEGSADEWETVSRLIDDNSLLNSDLSLEELLLENLQIVRSFSFLGEVEMPLVEKPDRHAVEISSASGSLPETLK